MADLIEASKNGDIETVRELLEDDIDPNIIDINGRTALMLASHYGHIDIARILLEYGALPNIISNIGWRALIYAIMNRHPEIVEILLEHGANPNIRDTWDNTALDLARRYGHEHFGIYQNNDMANLLRRHIAAQRLQSRSRGNMTRRRNLINFARTSRARQQLTASMLPVDYDISRNIGEHLSRMQLGPINIQSGSGYRKRSKKRSRKHKTKSKNK